jgi:elongation factor Ts
MVKELREATGAGVLDCRKALETAGGDMEKAAQILREKGAVAAAKKAEREAREGRIEGYIHPGNRVGVLVEVNCESDFVARTVSFQELAHELALHIAFANPRYIRPEDVPAADLEAEKAAWRKAGLADTEDQLQKFYEDNCLMEQLYVRDDKKRVKELVQQAIAQLGENVVVRRFVRYQLEADAVGS